MNCIMPCLPAHHRLPESTQTRVHWVSDAIQPSHLLLSPSPPALNLSQHQGQIKSVSASNICPAICHEEIGPDTTIFILWMLNFKPAVSLFSLTLIKSIFSCSSISSIRVVSFAYLRLLIFLLETLIPGCDSSSPAFHKMYSAYKLNKHSDNIQPCHTPLPILKQLVIPYKVLIFTSWPAHRFPRWQVR